MSRKAAIFQNVELPSFTWHWRSWEDVKQSTWFTKINWINIVMLLAFVALAIYQARTKMEAAKKAGYEKRFLKAPNFPIPEEQPDFDHTKTESVKLRPFKPKYNITMALETLDPNDLLLVDKNYADRMTFRASTMSKHGGNVVNVDSDDRIRPAVKEYYTYIMGTYLPLRFPDIFKLHETDYDTGKTFMLENRITRKLDPASPVSPMTSTKSLLEILGRSIDDDILFLLPDPHTPEDFDAQYILHAYCCCCPSGWDPSVKLGLPLAAIHAPVPSYKDRLQGSMDRFFNRLESGKYVKRANWTVTTSPALYAAGDGTNHAREGDDVQQLDEIDLDVDSTFVRCERQTLHRLPGSKAVVFAFRTYMYPIEEVKNEGEGKGEELAQAIEGLSRGNAPGMNFYKKGVVWGEAVKRYLRS